MIFKGNECQIEFMQQKISKPFNISKSADSFTLEKFFPNKLKFLDFWERMGKYLIFNLDMSKQWIFFMATKAVPIWIYAAERECWKDFASSVQWNSQTFGC